MSRTFRKSIAFKLAQVSCLAAIAVSAMAIGSTTVAANASVNNQTAPHRWYAFEPNGTAYYYTSPPPSNAAPCIANIGFDGPHSPAWAQTALTLTCSQRVNSGATLWMKRNGTAVSWMTSSTSFINAFGFGGRELTSPYSYCGGGSADWQVVSNVTLSGGSYGSAARTWTITTGSPLPWAPDACP